MFQRKAPGAAADWHSAWLGQEILIGHGEQTVDRIAADSIERVIFAHEGETLSAGDLPFAVVEAGADCLLLPAATGFAGRVHFERQNFWDQRNCIYWVPARQAPLPPKCLTRQGLLRSVPRFIRLPRAELAPFIERWPLEGPQSWDQRRWSRIGREQPFGRNSKI